MQRQARGAIRLERQSGAVTLLLACLMLAPTLGHAQGPAALAELERRIERDHPGVAHMPPQALEQRLAARDDGVLVLDVRESAEHAVSRIPGALRVDPSIDSADFQRRFGEMLAGRTVVLYCSVGVRSSRLALRVADVARKGGAAGVYNLSGGIFAWANQSRPLAVGTGDGPTADVHPYSASWGRYLDDQGRARYAPR